MRVLVAFDKFKGSMTAPDACGLAAEILLSVPQRWAVDVAPLTDGGEGFVEVLAQAMGGFQSEEMALGPRFANGPCRMGWVELARLPASVRTLLAVPAEGRLAIVEMAQASGLQKLSATQRNPWQTSSFGTGQLLRRAGQEAQAILLGIGGSATNDLGLGALEALGLFLVNRDGIPLLRSTPARWTEAVGIEDKLLRALPPLRIATDVANPLLGAHGATAIYGPQKGLADDDIPALDQACARLARLLLEYRDLPSTVAAQPGMGAAGGLGFGLRAAFRDQAQLVSGWELTRQWLDLERRVAEADVIVTGEGQFDATSWGGKGPGSLAQQALALGKEVWIMAGRVTDAARRAAPGGPGRVIFLPITPDDMPLDEALPAGQQLLARALSQKLGFGML